jgi:hypothetical protein
MTIHRRLGIGLLVAVACIGAFTASASAATPANVKQLFRNCDAHRGALTADVSPGTLRQVHSWIREHDMEWSDCGRAVSSRVVGERTPTARSASAAIDDCIEHGGQLTTSYATKRLRDAITELTPEQRTETRCQIGLMSQLNGRIEKPIMPSARPTRPSSKGVSLTSTLSTLGLVFPAFARPRDPIADAIPAELADFIKGSGGDVDQTRVIGSEAHHVFLVPGAGTLCLATRIADNAVLGCGVAAAWKDTLSVAVMLAPGGVAVWGPAPAYASKFRLLDANGRRRTVAPTNGLLWVTSKLVPRLLTWQDADGATHYQDFTTQACLPGQPCPKTR